VIETLAEGFDCGMPSMVTSFLIEVSKHSCQFSLASLIISHCFKIITVLITELRELANSLEESFICVELISQWEEMLESRLTKYSFDSLHICFLHEVFDFAFDCYRCHDKSLHVIVLRIWHSIPDSDFSGVVVPILARTSPEIGGIGDSRT